jgi:hypothetical protein
MILYAGQKAADERDFVTSLECFVPLKHGLFLTSAERIFSFHSGHTYYNVMHNIMIYFIKKKTP